MFKESQIGCHLLLGNQASTKLIILLGSLILLLNGVIGNDVRSSNRLTPSQNQTRTLTSVQNNVQQVNHLLPLLDFNYRYGKDAYVDEKEFYRLKRKPLNKFNSNKKSLINQTSSIRLDKNDPEQAFVEISSTSQSPSKQLFNPPSTAKALSNDRQEKTTNDTTGLITTTAFPTTTSVTNNSGDSGVVRSTATVFKGSTNIGYKHRNYDRNEMRKQSRLSKESNLTSWNGLIKLIFLLLICTAGTTGNIFVISSIMVVGSFQMQGNIYIVSLALAQLLISIVALPGTCIEIMVNNGVIPAICHLQWLLTQFTLVILLISFMLISIENCSALRKRSLVTHNLFCTKLRIVLLVLLTWTIAGVVVYAQHKYELAPALCQHELNKNTVWLQYHWTVCISIVLLPTVITMLCFLRCALRVKSINIQFDNNPLGNNWQLVMADGELVKANILVYFYTFLSWLPLCIMAPLSVVRQVNMDWLNAGWWLCWFNSCSYPFVYAFFNQNFNKTFFKLFFYCCCKTHLQFDGKTAININYQRRNDNSSASTSNVELRVHMIPGFNMNPRRDEGSMTTTSGFGGGGGGGFNNYNVKNQRYGTVTVGRHTRTIPASDGGLGFGGSGSSHHHSIGGGSGGFNKWQTRVDSDQGNYSGGGMSNRYGSSGYNTSHLVDAKDYSNMYDYGSSKHHSFGPSNQKYYI